MRPRPESSLVVLLLAALVVPPSAADATCEGPEYRQFDFWLGQWQVFGSDGRLAGMNLITREHGGCALRERYSTPGHYGGESLNAYDARRGVWHQTWVDNSGTVLLLEGGLDGTDMVLQGDSRTPTGEPVTHRIRWTPLAGGDVRQHWQARRNGADWTTVFDGHYRRLPAG